MKAPSKPVASDDRDLDKSFEAAEILRIACKKGGTMRVRRRGNKEIHYASTRLTTGLHHPRSQVPVTFSNRLVDR